MNVLNLVSDYRNNIPLEMLEAKYKTPIHEIINILYSVSVKKEK
jgi:hypothetical protein